NGTPIRASTAYHAEQAMAFSLFITPSVAVELTPKLQLGAGINVIYTNVSKSFDKDMGGEFNALFGANVIAPEDPAFAAPTQVNASGLGLGWTVGLQLVPHDKVRIGLDYVSATESDLDTQLVVGAAPVM